MTDIQSLHNISQPSASRLQIRNLLVEDDEADELSRCEASVGSRVPLPAKSSAEDTDAFSNTSTSVVEGETVASLEEMHLSAAKQYPPQPYQESHVHSLDRINTTELPPIAATGLDQLASVCELISKSDENTQIPAPPPSPVFGNQISSSMATGVAFVESHQVSPVTIHEPCPDRAYDSYDRYPTPMSSPYTTQQTFTNSASLEQSTYQNRYADTLPPHPYPSNPDKPEFSPSQQHHSPPFIPTTQSNFYLHSMQSYPMSGYEPLSRYTSSPTLTQTCAPSSRPSSLYHHYIPPITTNIVSSYPMVSTNTPVTYPYGNAEFSAPPKNGATVTEATPPVKYEQSNTFTFVNNPSETRVKRKRATPEQLEVLNKVFETTPFPSAKLREEVARELKMEPRTVQVWFQNRRQSFRSKAKNKDAISGRSSPTPDLKTILGRSSVDSTNNAISNDGPLNGTGSNEYGNGTEEILFVPGKFPSKYYRQAQQQEQQQRVTPPTSPKS